MIYDNVVLCSTFSSDIDSITQIFSLNQVEKDYRNFSGYITKGDSD